MSMKQGLIRATIANCRRQIPTCNAIYATNRMQSANSKTKISFGGPLKEHLIDIKVRHQQMSDQLMESDKLEISEITRISKECAELSNIVELIDERIGIQQSISELQILEKEESSR
jgi:hypothetical protein